MGSDADEGYDRPLAVTPSRARGVTQAQLDAIGPLTRGLQRAELEVTVKGGLDGRVLVTIADRWAAEHYLIDAHGVIERPTHAVA